MMKRQWSVWLKSWWLSKRLWNIDRVLIECWNYDKNVNVLKWPIRGGYSIEMTYEMLIGLLWI